ncbi:MAG: ABC1 kinase family protein [Candidatus Bathyarchaeia archaeon]
MFMWTLREIRRLFEITRKFTPVMLRYSADRRMLLRAKNEKIDRDRLRRHAAQALNVFVDLGPTFVKLGQVLSTRPDVVPQEYIDELSKLQDEVPPAPFDEVKHEIEEDLGPLDRVFDSFDENALSGASLGQVYRAVVGGRDVAVKVNRPHIHETVSLDLKILKKLFPLWKRFTDEALTFSGQAILDEFSLTIFNEMDYKLEAENLLRIKHILRHDRKVIVPDVLPEYTSKRVLTITYEPGIKITDLEGLRKAGLDLNHLARRVHRLFLKMLLTADIFHADPHPGNISVKEDGALILYDYGLVGSLDEKTRKKLIRLYLAMADRDPSKIMSMLIKLGTLQPNTNLTVIKRGIELAIVGLEGRKIEEMELKELMEVANRTIYQFPFRLPRYLVIYMRMSIILEGVCRTLNIQFNFIKSLAGLLDEEGLKREAIIDDYKDFFHRMGEALEASVDIAPMLKSFLEYSYPAALMQRKSGGSIRTVGVILGGALIVGSSILYTQNAGYGAVGFIVAAVTLIVSFLWRH